MNLCIQTYTMARGREASRPMDIKALCAFTRKLGLDAIDWCGTHGLDPREIRRVTDDFGIRNVCHTIFGADLDQPSPATRAPGRDAFRAGLDIARTLGANMVMLPPKGNPAHGRGQSFRNYVSGLNEVMPDAKAAGIAVTVEHFPTTTSPFVSSDDLNRAVAEVPGLKICFDNGNVTTAGEKAGDAFRKNAAHVVHAHFKDFEFFDHEEPGSRQGLDGRWMRSALVGEGGVDQRGTLQAMKDCGFAGHINFEYEGSQLTPTEATIVGVRRIRRWMKEIGIAYDFAR